MNDAAHYERVKRGLDQHESHKLVEAAEHGVPPPCDREDYCETAEFDRSWCRVCTRRNR